MNSYDYLFKFIIVGDTNVGKSSILLRFIEKRFREEYDPTIGVEFGSKIINLEQKEIKLQIWDTAGQESFKSITRSYYRGSIGALLVFDLTSKESYVNILRWLKETQTYANEEMGLALIGNKIDLNNKREVDYEEAQNFAKENGLEYIETSAKTGENIDESFLKVSKIIHSKILKNEIDPYDDKFGIKLGRKRNVESTINFPEINNNSCNC